MSTRSLFENTEEELVFCLRGLSETCVAVAVWEPTVSTVLLICLTLKALNSFSSSLNMKQVISQSFEKETKKHQRMTWQHHVLTSNWIKINVNKVDVKGERVVSKSLFFLGFFFCSFYLRVGEVSTPFPYFTLAGWSSFGPLL